MGFWCPLGGVFGGLLEVVFGWRREGYGNAIAHPFWGWGLGSLLVRVLFWLEVGGGLKI